MRPLTIAALVGARKCYVLPYWLKALDALQWPGDKRLRIVYDGTQPGDFAVHAGPAVSILPVSEITVPMDNRQGTCRIAMLHEALRRALVREGVSGGPILWVDSDVLVPPHTAEQLWSHRKPLASGVVASRGGMVILARRERNLPAMKPDDLGIEPEEVAITGFACLMMDGRLLTKFHWRDSECEKILQDGNGEDGHAILETGERVLLDPGVICVHYSENLVGHTVALAGDVWEAVTMPPQMRLTKVPHNSITYRGPLKRVSIGEFGDFSRQQKMERGRDLAPEIFDDLAGAIRKAQQSHAVRVAKLKALKPGVSADTVPLDYDESLLKFALEQGEGTELMPVSVTPPSWLGPTCREAPLPLGCDDFCTGKASAKGP